MNNSLILKIYPRSTIERIDYKTKLLGQKISTSLFLLIKLISSISIFIIVLLTSNKGYFLAPILFILSLFFSEYILDLMIKKRGKRLERESLFFFEILALTLSSDRSLKQALNLTVNNISGELSLEFKKALNEINLGKSLTEALESLKSRIPSDIINNIILNMIESSINGTDIVKGMYNGIDFLRKNIILDIKGEINQLPTKVSIISVIFFIPIMMLIILAPVLINYLTK